MATTLGMEPVVNGHGGGCRSCRDTRPPVQTSYRPDGVMIRQQKCGRCRTVWAFEQMTREQAVALGAIDVITDVLRDLANAVTDDGHADPGSGAPRYTAAMNKIEQDYSPEAAGYLRAALVALRNAVDRSYAGLTQASAPADGGAPHAP